MRSFVLLFGLACLTTWFPSLVRAQSLPPGYEETPEADGDAREATEPWTGAPTAPDTYQREEAEPGPSDQAVAPVVAPPPSPERAALLEHETQIRADYHRLLDEGRRYRWGRPVALVVPSGVGLVITLMELADARADSSPQLPVWRGLVGSFAILATAGLSWLIWSLVRTVEWRRRFRPVEEQYETLQETTIRLVW